MVYVSKFNHIALLFVALLFGVFLNAQAIEIPEKPSLETAVYDGAGIFSPSQKNTLEQKLIHYADSTSTQIVVISVQSTQGEDIGYYATQWAHKWGIGQKDKDNGVLILVAVADKKMTIRTGYGLEYLLTDALSRRVIENVMAPQFRKGDYYTGIDQAVDTLFQIFAGSYQNDAKAKGSWFPFIVFLVFFIIIIIIIFSNSNHSGGSSGGRLSDDIFGPIILSRGGRSSGWGGSWGGSWGGGSSGGGGFSGGFGGGGFGGGGASGGW